jgi:cell division protein FtsB
MGKSKIKSKKLSSPVTPSLRRSARSKPSVTQNSGVNFSVEISDLTSKNQGLVATNNKLTRENDKLMREHEVLTVRHNDLNEYNARLTLEIHGLSENNKALYNKYQENMLGCNKNLKTCITQFEKEEEILKQNIENEKAIQKILVIKIHGIKIDIHNATNKVNDLMNKKGGSGSSKSRDPREGLKTINAQLESANKDLKKDIESLKANIAILNENIAKLELEKNELEKKQWTLNDANTDFARFIGLVQHIQLLEKEYATIQSENEKLQIKIKDLTGKKMDLNKEYVDYYQSTVAHETTVKKRTRRRKG